MPDQKITVEAILTDSKNEEIDRATIDSPGRHRFRDIKPGKYTITLITPEKIEVVLLRKPEVTVTEERYSIAVSIWQKLLSNQLRADVWIEGIRAGCLQRLIATIAGIGSLLYFSPSACSPGLDSRSVPRTPVQSNSIQPPSDASIELTECLRDNLVTVSQVVTPDDFTDIEAIAKFTLSGVEGENSEAIGSAIDLYEKYQRVRDFAENFCDASLLASLTEIEDSNSVSDQTSRLGTFQSQIFIDGEDVNVRSVPSLNGSTVATLSYENVTLDAERFNRLSAEEKISIQHGDGWYPIITSRGIRGYVYSQYAKHLAQ